jgi:predicted ATPase with chaperone activity
MSSTLQLTTPGDTLRHAPPVPRSLADTGLDASFLDDLLMKTLYRGGARSGAELVGDARIEFAILDNLLLDLQQRHLVQVRRTDGHGRLGYVFDLTSEGRARAREAMAQSRYVGPAPVPFELYVDWVEHQSVCNRDITPQRMREVLQHLVLDDSLIDAVGAAANSGTALFLYGSPGNGKTAVARAIAAVFDDPIYVPYAIAVQGGTIIQLYDPLFHQPVASAPTEAPAETSILRDPPTHDPRFARVGRPAVTVGGELSMGQLELQPDESAGVYRAPLQLKANGGVFVLDDFGRQRIPSRDLLNRWMVPLEDRVDYLSLPTGHKLPVPFDCFLVFSTNLSPTELVEEAFLRRLRYKVPATDPTREQFETIMRRGCEAGDLAYSAPAVDLVYRDYYARLGVTPRACHPRDLIAHIRDEASYRGLVPEMTTATMDRACRTYFLELPDASGQAATGTTPDRSD